jgi:low temperature requirement protein LtrA
VSTTTEPAQAEAEAEPIGPERRTTPVELLWDLVFVFALTQVTTLLRLHLSWGGFGKAMLALGLMWWAWSAFVWAVNAQAETERTMQLTLLVAMAFIFVAGLALPHAFGARAVLFAVTYAIVRFLHLALYADASRRGNASWSAIAGFAVTVSIGMVLLVIGALIGGAAQIVLWTAAVAIDYAGPAWLTRERLRGLQRVAVAHFAERYGLFVIICLGESIVAIGSGAVSTVPVDADRVVAVTLCLLITMGLWWTYFDRLAGGAEERLREDDDPVLAAADSYSYLHLVIVAGIVIFAVGARLLVHTGDAPLSDAGRLALTAGVATYLLGLVAFKLRLLRESSLPTMVAAVALLALGVFGSGIDGLLVAAITVAVLAVLCAVAAAHR